MGLQKAEGFSLVEVTLAIGIVAFALLAILGLLPVGTQSARDSADTTRVVIIAQDAINRIRAYATTNDPSNTQSYFGPYQSGDASFFFYNSDGARTSNGSRTGELIRVSSAGDKPNHYTDPGVPNPADFYRAKVTVSAFDQSVTYQSYDPRLVSGTAIPTLLCATVEVAWPVNHADGSILGANHRAVFSFVLRKP